MNDCSLSVMIRDDLSKIKELAVMFGNFNYQVENGGLLQWDDNDYSKDLGSLYAFLDDCDYNQKAKFMQVLDDFSYVKTAIKELDRFNDWYDKDYVAIQDDWKNYFENYLLNNMPNEYKQMLFNLNENINI